MYLVIRSILCLFAQGAQISLLSNCILVSSIDIVTYGSCVGRLFTQCMFVRLFFVYPCSAARITKLDTDSLGNSDSWRHLFWGQKVKSHKGHETQR